MTRLRTVKSARYVAASRITPTAARHGATPEISPKNLFTINISTHAGAAHHINLCLQYLKNPQKPIETTQTPLRFINLKTELIRQLPVNDFIPDVMPSRVIGTMRSSKTVRIISIDCV